MEKLKMYVETFQDTMIFSFNFWPVIQMKPALSVSLFLLLPVKPLQRLSWILNLKGTVFSVYSLLHLPD